VRLLVAHPFAFLNHSWREPKTRKHGRFLTPVTLYCRHVVRIAFGLPSSVTYSPWNRPCRAHDNRHGPEL
jgi:hypothetical protein